MSASSTKGHRAELSLSKSFKEHGYEVRRAAASRFPDLIVWNSDSFHLVEVKIRNYAKGAYEAKSLFKDSARQVIPPPQGALLLALRNCRKWELWEYSDWIYDGTEATGGKLVQRFDIFPWLTGGKNSG